MSRGTDADSTADGPTRAAVRDRLGGVTDPELDRSVVELEYIDRLIVEPPRVHVEFTLPTAWCSPAFAWMMAVDMREAAESVGDIDRCTVDLRDHMHGEEITEGVNAGEAFEAVFEDATEGIDPVREKLDRKALLARQYEAVESLLDVDVHPEQICALTREDCTVYEAAGYVAVDLEGLSVCVDREPLARYLAKVDELGVVSGPQAPLFRDRDGEPISPDRFERVHAETRVTTVNMRGQGGICDALHEARYGEGRPAGEEYAWE
jgi:metal-sulfur cluster biosynthetic enzyme